MKEPSDRAPRGQRERTEFLDITAHDLRAPLANIRSYAEIASSGRAGGAPPTVLRALEVILRNADKALVLIQDYIDSRRGDLAALDLALTPTSLGDLWSELASSALSTRLDERGIELRLEIEPGLPDLSVDRRRLARVLQLLLDRAAARAPDGSRIVAFTRREGQRLATGVTDRGPALDVGAPDELFDRQGAVIRERQLAAGLALPLARSVARAHGGDAELRQDGGLQSCLLLLPL
ncbi:MAG: sensor histidine kinase [Deltaproteobacteria bacterium]